jgi:hypothetical protein
MPVFFDGRLYTTPAVLSAVDDTAMYNKNLSVGNVLALIGASEGGEPNKALRFGSPYEAIRALRSGALLDAVLRAFDPSAQSRGPATIVAVRVNPAVRASLALKDAGDVTVIDLVSTDYGKYTNGIKIKVESGSTAGKKLTTQFGNAYYSQDDVARQACTVVYTGAEATATITINGTTVTLAAPAGSTVATIDLAAYDTVQKLVDRINVVPGFDSVVLDGNGERAALQGLDFVTAQSVKTTAYTVTANLQAVVDWINGQAEGFVTATRPAGVGAVPANINFTYLDGGSDGTTTNTEWSDAFSTLQSEDVQWVVPLSSSASIHAMADAHCGYMSNVARMERRAFVGMASGSTDAAAIAAAKNLNSDRTALVHIGMYDYDSTGTLHLYEPYILAAMIAGAFAGVNPGTAMTNKALKIRGLERKVRNPTDTDLLIRGGVLAVEDTTKGFKVVKSISTWLNNLNYNRVEISTGAAVDFVARNVRNALEDMVGQKGNPTTLRLAIEKADSVLRELARPEPVGPGVIVGDADNPAYRNITAEIEGDVMRVEFECSPVIPINYIPVTIHAVPWKGKITQA